MNIEHNITHLLKQNNLRTTSIRRLVLKTLLEAGNTAVSSHEIETKFEDLDRITLYRTLKSFEEAGMIHQIMDASGKSKYALCFEDCSNHHHLDHHAHFYCKKCEKTVCLEKVKIPVIQLPKNFQLEDQQLVLSGICDVCLG